MRRALFACLLALAACQGQEGGPRVAPGTTVGKVIEVQGEVTATRDGQPRALVAGADIAPDDIVATTATGSVRIELFHNHAKLELQRGATSRIDGSLAWDLTAAQVAELPNGEVTVSAGRNGERTAAESASTAGRAKKPARGELEIGTASGSSAAPQPGSTADPDPATEEKPTPPPRIVTKPPPEQPTPNTTPRPPTKAKHKESVKTGSTPTPPVNQSPNPDPRRTSPPPPPPPDDTEAADKENDGPVDDRLRGGGETAKTTLAQRLDAARTQLAVCLTGGITKLTITVAITKGTASFRIADASAESARECVQRVIDKLDVTGVDGHATIEIVK